MKRWIPSILLISFVVVLSLYMFVIDQVDTYIPNTTDPVVVYREACARCHGEKGEGSAILYPALSGQHDIPEDVRRIVREGATFMPSFPNIPDSVLSGLAEYIARKKYLIGDQGALKR